MEEHGVPARPAGVPPASEGLYARADLTGGTSLAFTVVPAGNLGLHVGEDPAAVQANRRGLERLLGIPERGTLFLEQVHGTAVARAEDQEPLRPRGAAEERAVAPVADAAVTSTGRPLAVLTADCLPIVFTSEDPGLYGVAHAGRRGLLDGVVGEAVRTLRALGGTGLTAWIGPAICGACYEVPEEMARDAVRLAPGIASRTSWGTPSLDLRAAAEERLRELGVPAAAGTRGCTAEETDLYSHRREPGAGRIAGIVWRRGEDTAEERSTTHG
nr:polyphenol oxidase family protein [Rothia halotolerans]